MRPLFTMLALLAGATVPVANASANAEYDRYLAWGYACELTPESCVGLLVPEVEYVTNEPGLRGYYEGGDTVFIGDRLRPGADLMSTLIHEMIHYIHVKTGKAEHPFEPESLCWSENEAFSLVDSWLVEQGFPDLVRGPNWWVPYWYCHPYYDPDWELWDWVESVFGELQ